MKNNKTFAFKLAQKNQVANKDKKTQWKAREGVAVAGCTTSNSFPYEPRFSDNGIWC